MKKINGIFKNLSYAVMTNLVTFVTSVVSTAILPKVMGVTEYSYWQLYMFYATYVIYLQLGWLEGIYLREGGKSYAYLDKQSYHRQLRCLMLYAVILCAIIILITLPANQTVEKKYVFIGVALYLILIFIKTFFSYIFQATGEISVYERINIIERLIFCIGMIVLIFIGMTTFWQMIVFDLAARIVGLSIALYYAKDIIKAKPAKFQIVRRDIKENIQSGSKLMFATVAGLLIIGIIRWCIEQHWNIETFGKVSFTISISNLVVTFIGAVSVVLFPMLRHIQNRNKQVKLYQHIRIVLGVVAFFLMIFYLPMKYIIELSLPDYQESVRYMALIFPICFFESKMSILILTFLKTLRKEKIILEVNLISVLISIVVAAVTIFMLDNLPLAVFGIFIVLAVKCILAELFLAKYLEIDVRSMIIEEVLLSLLFVVANWSVQGVKGFIVYVIGFDIYLVINWREFKHAIQYFRTKLES